MTVFPRTVHFTGLNAPVRIESSVQNLQVEGDIPAEVDGAFFRAVPDNAHAPMFDDDIALNADGMVRVPLRHRRGRPRHQVREHHRYATERKARNALFGHYRNPFTDDPSVASVDRTVSNTTPVWHAGRLFMTKEDGHP